MDKERVITIKINGFTTKLLIPEEKEEVYRNAAKILNERISVYNSKFSLPYPDILSMVAYEMAVEAVTLEMQQHTAPISIMEELSSLIEQELDNID
ncbi:MAG: cell division protein ZapA [Paludibacteraceae bacterium]|jgi:cell division protein ZapA (FtsZ GTPase activity inhibitor)|nr:cell division protein ZapA [Paludibacteraceae bacterium]